MNKIHNVIIIGSGPAGYTAAIYAARSGLNPIIITGNEVGGQLMTTTEVENFPGYKNGINGQDMMDDLKEQAIRFETDLIYQNIIGISKDGDIFNLILEDSTIIKSKAVIIATGASAKYLGLESEDRFKGIGISACATCDGFFYRDKNVVVIGGGDTAFEEALYLSKICNNVSILVRSDIKASDIIKKRVLSTNNIKVLLNTTVKEFIGDDNGLTSLLTNHNDIITCDGAFIAIGHQPNSALFGNLVSLDKNGYIITEPGSTKTKTAGLFACGDVQDSIYRQAVTAAGTGCMAAIDSKNYIDSI